MTRVHRFSFSITARTPLPLGYNNTPTFQQRKSNTMNQERELPLYVKYFKDKDLSRYSKIRYYLKEILLQLVNSSKEEENSRVCVPPGSLST